MDLLPTELQEEIAQAADAVLRKTLPFRRVQELSVSELDDHALWDEAAREGWSGIGIPSEFGGAGGGVTEELMLFRELGRHLAPGPFLGSVLGAHVALSAGETDLVQAILSGKMRLGLAWPQPGRDESRELDQGSWISGGPIDVDGITVVSDVGAVILLGEMKTTVFDGIDQLMPRVLVDGPLDAVASAGGNEMLKRGQILLAGELVGVAEATRDISAEHAKTRSQFGQAIGAFQAVKHRCADMAVRCESAWASTSFATAALVGQVPELSFYAASAKVLAGRAAIDNAMDNVQNHGAMGFTEELGAHLYLRRAQALDNALTGPYALLDYLRGDQCPRPVFR